MKKIFLSVFFVFYLILFYLIPTVHAQIKIERSLSVDMSWITGEEKEIITKEYIHRRKRFIDIYSSFPNLFFYGGIGSIDRDLKFKYIGGWFDIPLGWLFNSDGDDLSILDDLSIILKGGIVKTKGLLDWKPPYYNIPLKEEYRAFSGGVGLKHVDQSIWTDTKLMFEVRFMKDVLHKKESELYQLQIDSTLGGVIIPKPKQRKFCHFFWQDLRWESYMNINLNLHNYILNLIVEPKFHLMRLVSSEGRFEEWAINLQIGSIFRTMLFGKEGTPKPIGIGGMARLSLVNQYGYFAIQGRWYAQNHNHKVGSEYTIMMRINF